MKKSTKRNGRKVTLLLFAMLFLIVGLYVKRYCFTYGTTINGVDCSFLTEQLAAKKIEKTINQKIVFTVITQDGQEKEYVPDNEQLEKFEIKVSSVAIKNALDIQKEEKTKEYNFSNLFSIDGKAIREYLETIPELTDNVTSQNAYLRINESNLLEVIPEVIGNEVDFEEAVEFAEYLITKGSFDVDFSFITKYMVEIKADDTNLLQCQEDVNSILQSVINFTLSDGEVITLDSTTMKDWLEEGEDGLYTVNLEDNVEEFVTYLSEKVENAKQVVAFQPTGDDIDTVFFTLNDTYRINLDIESEIAEITEDLQAGGTYNVEPIYEGKLCSNLLSSYETVGDVDSSYFLTYPDTYIELDITRQTLWLYVEGECILESECVTGCVSKGYSTPTGLYFLTYKTQNAVLRGYNADGSQYASSVKYWMPFNGGIGFHDASWRSKFGGQIYQTNGSHGCINMPTTAASILYEYIDTSIPIVVYAS